MMNNYISLFQFLAIGEGIAYALTEFDIAHMNGIESDNLHLLYIGLSISSKVLLKRRIGVPRSEV